MQTITVQITNESAIKTLQNLQKKHFIRIINQSRKASIALPGKPLTPEEFKNWITKSEKANAITFREAKTVWATKRKRLSKIVK